MSFGNPISATLGGLLCSSGCKATEACTAITLVIFCSALPAPDAIADEGNSGKERDGPASAGRMHSRIRIQGIDCEAGRDMPSRVCSDFGRPTFLTLKQLAPTSFACARTDHADPFKRPCCDPQAQIPHHPCV